MRRSPEELQSLVREYQKNLSEASIPFWMDVPDILDILDHFEQTQQTIEAELCFRLAQRMHPEDSMGEVYILAVDPPWRRRGIARRLIERAESRTRGLGMRSGGWARASPRRGV